MTIREFHYRWEWQLKSSPEALWPLVADTNRFNHDAKIPAVEQLPASDDERGGHHLRLYRFDVFGRPIIPIEWYEEPFEWVRPQRFGVMRRYARGPLATMRTLVELNARPDGGTNAIYDVVARSRNRLGGPVIALQIGLISRREFRRVFYEYDRLAQDQQLPLELKGDGHFPPGGRVRLAALRDALHQQTNAHEIIDRLAQTIEEGDDITVSRLRPYALADYWGAPRRTVLEVCLLATRAGLLDFRWDVLCPLCRGAKHSSRSLSELRPEVHCDTCNIDFSANFDRSVELTFRPNAAIRVVDAHEFCIAGPLVTPHVAAQQRLETGEARALTVSLAEGRYRLRALSIPGGQYIRAAADGPDALDLILDADGWPNAEPLAGLNPTLRLQNSTDATQLFILEHMIWSDQAATAAEVTNLQLFRDLFASEALRPGDRISVGRLTVLFTDLRDSTRIYREIGDAPAFGLVMSHFDILREAVAAQDGAVVKTIGDAVMASFQRPIAALKAILSARERLAASGAGQPLTLKAGIHTGPSIAVTLNGHLDYFGTMVNVAARLEGLSSGGDIIISREVYEDPEVADYLRDDPRLRVEPFEAMLKGFDTERFCLWRVSPARALVSPEVT